MIRKLLEDNGIISTDTEFKMLMDAVTDDVKFNQIKFGKRTRIYEIVAICAITINMLRRCNLDGTELYGPDGQTIADITELTPEETNKLLEGGK